ncbi:MAG: glycoside hydrolase family 3 N-terminal domain-containing protein [Candidatus Neoclostridium sp.]
MISRFSDDKLREIVASMSVREKAAQMTQLNANMLDTDENGEITGPAADWSLTKEDVFAIGSTLNFKGVKRFMQLQKAHLEGDPHRIPLLGMMDIIHGCHTVYPVPIALGCSFEPQMVEELCSMAAREAAACGVQVTFAPMCDLARDARWGRVVETTGEDPYMNGLYAAAATRGFQGDDLGDENKVAACLKHFACYGAAEAGRDYNTVDMSERTAREYYLKAYKAAVDAGIAMAMTSFNVYDGIPLTANKALAVDVLRKEWGFDGVVISDYNAFGEMVTHGYEQDGAKIAVRAFEAGEDIEMMSPNYLFNMEKLVKSGRIDEKELDEHVFRILKLKRDLGMFDDPFRGLSEQREKDECLTEQNRALVRKAAEKSSVLLKNEAALPLGEESVALVGPFADAGNIIGTWRAYGKSEDTVTVKAAFEKDGKQFTYARGCGWGLKETDESGFEEAIAVARRAEKVVMCLGEEQDYSGEGKSRADIRIPELQVKLLKKIKEVNENIILVLFTGRPLVLTEVAPLCKAIAVVWQPGTEGGSAIENLLFGKVNFSGKLSMSFPYHVAQCPIFYNRMNTGRPCPADYENAGYTSRYLDVPDSPLYPYGYGLSYSEFKYGELTLSSDKMDRGGIITASVEVTNASDVDGEEVVQLYIHDLFASRVRPVKELKAYKKVLIKAGETVRVDFDIDENMLKFWDENMDYVAENGEFDVFVGGCSCTKNKARFVLQ